MGKKNPFDKQYDRPALRHAREMQEAPAGPPEPPPPSTFPETAASRAARELAKQGEPGLFDPEEEA